MTDAEEQAGRTGNLWRTHNSGHWGTGHPWHDRAVAGSNPALPQSCSSILSYSHGCCQHTTTVTLTFKQNPFKWEQALSHCYYFSSKYKMWVIQHPFQIPSSHQFQQRHHHCAKMALESVRCVWSSTGQKDDSTWAASAKNTQKVVEPGKWPKTSRENTALTKLPIYKKTFRIIWPLFLKRIGHCQLNLPFYWGKNEDLLVRVWSQWRTKEFRAYV